MTHTTGQFWDIFGYSSFFHVRKSNNNSTFLANPNMSEVKTQIMALIAIISHHKKHTTTTKQ